MASLSILIWQFMAYAIVTSTVVKLGHLISSWEDGYACLLRHSPKFDYTFDKPQMSISLIVELYKIAKARLLLTLRHPANEKTSDAGTEAMTGMVCEASKGTSRK